MFILNVDIFFLVLFLYKLFIYVFIESYKIFYRMIKRNWIKKYMLLIIETLSKDLKIIYMIIKSNFISA